MRYHTATYMQPKWRIASAILTAAIILIGVTLATRAGASPGTIFVVDDDGKATASNCGSSAVTPYSTVSAAVAAAADGDTVKVCPGAYVENVTVDKDLTVKGAQADTQVWSRVFGGAQESTITGQVTIQAEGVKLTGFSLTNPNQGTGVLVKATANDAVIKKNIVSTVGSNTFTLPVVGIYLEQGPDGVVVANNRIKDIQSQSGSAQGVLVGDSLSADPSVNTTIASNTISDIASVLKGAYGVQLNNGASTTVATATGYTEAEVSYNIIRNLSGNWTHAIGLEGETPNVVVTYNTISDLTDNNPVPAADVIAVYFEDNPFFFTAKVNHNSLDVSDSAYGIAVNPTLAARYASLEANGECNWWGAKNGPGAVAAGGGSLVGAGVNYDAWLKSSNLNRGCEDDHRGHKDRHDSWEYYFDNDWRY
jgi:hypothetical protein